MLQKKIEDLVKEAAIKFNLPYKVVHAIFMSEFKLTADEMRKLASSLAAGEEIDQKTIKIPALGKFIVSKSKLERIDYAAKEAWYKAKYGDRNDKNDGADKDKI